MLEHYSTIEVDPYTGNQVVSFSTIDLGTVIILPVRAVIKSLTSLKEASHPAVGFYSRNTTIGLVKRQKDICNKIEYAVGDKIQTSVASYKIQEVLDMPDEDFIELGLVRSDFTIKEQM